MYIYIDIYDSDDDNDNDNNHDGVRRNHVLNRAAALLTRNRFHFKIVH